MALDYPRTIEDGLREALTLVGGETKIKVAGSFSGGAVTEYTEGATDATISGPAVMAEGAADTLRPIQVFELTGGNAIKTALVDTNGDQIASFGGGTQYTEGDTDATIVGTAAMMEVASDILKPVQGTVADGLLVNLGSNNDVTVTNTVDVSATNLDIRDLAFATDKVDASGSILGANSGVDIGDVTVNNGSGASAVNIQDGGNSLTVDNAALSVTGGGVEASALRVTIANDSTGVVSVDDNGGSITVDGTVAATQSGTWNINNISGTVSLPTGAATAALQTQPGVDIGDVTINNASGASAVNIQDGGNSISIDDGGGSVTVDGSVTVSGTVSLSGSVDTELTTADLDTGAGTDTRAVVGLVLAASGGGLLVGSANPMPVSDNGGSLTVDGTVAATQSGTWNITNISGTVSLPTGAATAALQTQPGVDIGDVTINNASGASAVNIQDGGNSITVDGTIAATQSGAWTFTSTTAAKNFVKDEDVASANADAGVPAMAVQRATPANSAGTDGDYEFLQMSAGRLWTSTTIDAALPAGSNTIGSVNAIQSGTWNINNISGTIALPTGAATETTLSSLNGKFASSTATLSNVGASVTSVTLLASNSSRKGAIFYNDCTLPCYVKFGTTASTSSFTVYLTANSHLILDDNPVYTGRVDGIWATAVGNMRVTELT